MKCAIYAFEHILASMKIAVLRTGMTKKDIELADESQTPSSRKKAKQ